MRLGLKGFKRLPTTTHVEDDGRKGIDGTGQLAAADQDVDFDRDRPNGRGVPNVCLPVLVPEGCTAWSVFIARTTIIMTRHQGHHRVGCRKFLWLGQTLLC